MQESAENVKRCYFYAKYTLKLCKIAYLVFLSIFRGCLVVGKIKAIIAMWQMFIIALRPNIEQII